MIDSVATTAGGGIGWRGDALIPNTAAGRIERFIEIANELARKLGRDHEVVPDDPAGLIVLSRFRQTIGWFINRLTGGRVALGIQYGHLQLMMSEAYGSRAGMDMMEILDLERARTLADTLAQAADRLRDGEHVSGPAAERYQASAAEFTDSYQGNHLTPRQYRALLNNPRLRVFDHDDALLACNHNPLTALCDPNRGTPGRTTGTPSFDRCNTACANVARTDTHIDRARREAADLQNEIDSGLNPYPFSSATTSAGRSSSRSSTGMSAANRTQSSRRSHLSDRPRATIRARARRLDRHQHRTTARSCCRCCRRTWRNRRPRNHRDHRSHDAAARRHPAAIRRQAHHQVPRRGGQSAA